MKKICIYSSYSLGKDKNNSIKLKKTYRLKVNRKTFIYTLECIKIYLYQLIFSIDSYNIHSLVVRMYIYFVNTILLTEIRVVRTTGKKLNWKIHTFVHIHMYS